MKKLKRVALRFKGLTVGFDLHKKWIEYCVLDEAGNEIDNGRLKNAAELSKCVDRLLQRGRLQFSIEACGCFMWVFDLLAKKCGRSSVHVAQPARIKVIANSMEKNDANDAWWLAYLLHEGRLPEAFVAEGDLRDLRLASRELRWNTDNRGDLLRRLRSHCAQCGIDLPKAWHTSNVKRNAARKLVRSGTSGERRHAMLRLMTQIRAAGKIVQHWRERIKELGEKFKDVQLMSEMIPGLGAITSGTIFAELGDPRRFYNQKAYAKSTGLTPGYRESGGRSSPTAITRAGSGQARWALTRAILACFSCRNGPGLQIKKWVQKRCAYKRKKAVIVAAARKLAEGIWRLFALGECFNLKKAFPA